jgi:hypothetical protein
MTNKAIESNSLSSLNAYIGAIIAAVQDVSPDHPPTYRASILGSLINSLRHIRDFRGDRYYMQDPLKASGDSQVSSGKFFVSDMYQAYLAGSTVAISGYPTFFAHIPKSGGSSTWHQLASLLNQANLTVGSNWNVLDVHQDVEEPTPSLRCIQILLGTQTSNACALALKAPGKAFIHIHAPGGIGQAICHSNWITMFRKPEDRIASVFRHWAKFRLKNGLPLDPPPHRAFWSDQNLVIKEWLQYNPSRHRVIVLNFKDITNRCGPFQGMLLGIGVPPVTMLDYTETKTCNDQNLMCIFEEALSNEKFNKTFRQVCLVEVAAWKSFGVPDDWLA